MERRLAAIMAADVAGYSRLMSQDEAGTLAALESHYSELMLPAVKRHRGRVFKRMGDGFLVEFGSVVEAVLCAAEIQHAMPERNYDVAAARKMALRIGIHLGDVIADKGDIYGDGVNVAARLEGIAEVGGICISRQAYEHIDGKLDLRFRELGPQNLKNIPKPVEAFAVDLEASAGAISAPSPFDFASQKIEYCRTADGVRLAYATVGNGPSLVKAGNWLNHLEYDWESPAWGHLLHGLAKEYTLTRYDPRGTGLSDWEVSDISLDAWVGDLAAVVEAAGVERFPLLGISQGCAVSIAYAVRHPGRVSHLILYGGFAVGAKKRSPAEKDKREAMITLMRLGWGTDNPAIRQMFTSYIFPGATKEQADTFNELQRRTTSPECAAAYYNATGDLDVTDLLPKVTVPALVMHARGDLQVPFDAGRQMAAGIPGARFVAMPGNNHVFLEQDPTAERFFEEIRLFLDR